VAQVGKPYPVYLVVDVAGDADFAHLTLEPYSVAYRWRGTGLTPQENMVFGTLPLVHPAGRSYIPILLPAAPESATALEIEVSVLGQHEVTNAPVQWSPDSAPLPVRDGGARLLGAAMNYDNLIRLSHVALDSDHYQAGETVAATLYWQKLSPDLTDEYVAFYRLVDLRTDREVLGENFSLGTWHGPPASWPVGSTAVDQHLLSLPAGLTPGEYRLELGLYNVTRQQFVPLVNEDGTQHWDTFKTVITLS
jgi:hypothetical protein